jgi:hypothetical protein
MKGIYLAIAVIVPFEVFSQTGIPSAVLKGLHGDVISLSGDIGTYGELYSISGRDSRRPSSTARLYFRPTISIYDAMTLSFNFLLSTEGSSRSVQHQLNQINQLGIRPQWAWGYANAGDFTETYTPYTLSGVTLRGGGVTINPGIFRFSAVGGFTSPSGYTISGGDRYMYGGRIGVGRESESHVDLVFIRVRDVPSTFQAVMPDTLPPVDSTQVGTLVNRYQESPQENLVLGLAGSVRMFDDAVRFSFEANGSAFTRDMTSSRLENEKIPKALTGIFTPRLSSSVDVAAVMGLHLNLPAVSFKAGYRYIGPGYTSLGVASLLNDQQEFQLGTQVRQVRWSASLDWSRQNDNLIRQKLNTTIRHRYNGSFTMRPLDVWNVSVLGGYMNMRNHSPSDTLRVDFATLTLGTNQAFMVSRNDFVRSVSLNYMFARSIDYNPLRSDSRSRTHTINVSAMMTATERLTIGAGVGIVNSRFGTQNATTTQSYTITPQFHALENRLISSLSVGISKAEGSTSIQTSLTSSYRLTSLNTITLAIRRTGLSTDAGSTGNYQEYTASLTISQRL